MVQNTKLGGRTLINGTGYDISLQSGTPLSDIPVGNTVKIAVNGTMRDWLVVNQGIPSGSTLYDDSCNGTWLLMKDIYYRYQWDSAMENAYENSTIHSYLSSTFFNRFDPNIRAAIKQVKIPYVKGGGYGGSNQSGSNGLLVRVFILSGPEVGLAAANYMPNDGAKLSYFNNQISNDPKRIAYLDGSASMWWLRSPCDGVRDGAFFVDDYGETGFYLTTNSLGIRPAMILPFETLVADDGTVLA